MHSLVQLLLKGLCNDATQRDIIEPGFIRLSPRRTHDITGTDHHADIKQIGEDLDEAIQAALPERHGIRYTRVLCLLLAWEYDDLGVDTE